MTIQRMAHVGIVAATAFFVEFGLKLRRGASRGRLGGPRSGARSTAGGSNCTCTPLVRRRYLARLSGPLLDRVDVKVELLPVGRAELLSDRHLAEPSAAVAGRVLQARLRAAHRLQSTRWRLNAEVPGSELRRSFRPEPGALAPLEQAMDRGQVSARGADRIIRMSWTLADLAGQARPRLDEIGAAFGLWLGTGL